MHTAIFLAALAVVAPVLAEELDKEDVPQACSTICEPIVTLTTLCDIDPNEKEEKSNAKVRRLARDRDEAFESIEEEIEATCICTNTSFKVSEVLALCASCISQNGKTSDDADKIMKQCGFAPQEYTPASDAAASGVQVEATKPTDSVRTTPSDGSRLGGPSITAMLIAGVVSLLSW